MTQTGETGFNTTLALPLSATALTLRVATAPTITKWRIKLGRGTLEEWVSFNWNPTPWWSNVDLTLTARWLSKTAIPSTAGTGLPWIAGTQIKIVFMHDQLDDRLEDATIPGAKTFSGAMVVNNSLTVSGATSYVKLPSLTTAERLALTPTNWFIVYDSNIGENYQYISWAWSAVSAGSTQPNASETVAGKSEEATQTQVETQVDTWETGARTFIVPSKINPNNITAATVVATDKFSFSDVSDSNKLKSSTIQWILDLANLRYWWNSSDWAIDGTSALTITWSNNTYIVKNYSSWAAGTSARICTTTPTGWVTHIKIKWDADLSNRTFSYSGKWAAGGAINTAGSPTTVALIQPVVNGWWSSWTPWWGGGGGASMSTNGTAWVGAWWVKWSTRTLEAIKYRRCIEIGPWWWWGGGVWGASQGAWWAWWWALIIEVWGNLTLNNSTTVINMNWVAWDPGSGSWWGWGWGGSVYIMYNGTLTWTCTPTVAWWAWWSTWWWAWWAWLQLIEKNVVFT